MKKLVQNKAINIINKKIKIVFSFIIFSLTELSLLILLYIELFRSDVFPSQNYTCSSKLLFMGISRIVEFVNNSLCYLHSILYIITPILIFATICTAIILSKMIKKDDIIFFKFLGYLILITFLISLACIACIELLMVRSF